MFSFFRKIRYKLLDEGHLSKYSAYALGEIILVVIGILIALQINNWNIQRTEKDLSLKTEQSLAVELAALKNNLDRSITHNNEIINNTNAYLDGEFVLNDESIDDVLLFTNYGLISLGTPILEREAGSDNLIVGKEELTEELRQIYYHIKRFENARGYMDGMWNTQVTPYMMKKKLKTEFRLFASNKPYNKKIVEEVYHDDEYKQLVASNNGYLSGIVFGFKELRKHVDKAISLIEQ